MASVNPGSSRRPDKGPDRRFDHPENDLDDDADYANLVPPEPRSAEELASSGDPVKRAEANRRSTRQAIWYVVGSVVVTLVVTAVLYAVFHSLGWSEADQKWWAALISIPPIVALLGCCVIMVVKLRSYQRWRPWMGAFWFLVPATMLWMTFTLQILAA